MSAVRSIRLAAAGLAAAAVSAATVATAETVTVNVTPPDAQNGPWVLQSYNIHVQGKDLLFDWSDKHDHDYKLIFLLDPSKPNARFDPRRGFVGRIPDIGDWSHCADDSQSKDDVYKVQFKSVDISDRKIVVKFGNHSLKHNNSEMYCNVYHLSVITAAGTSVLDPVTQNGDGAALHQLQRLQRLQKKARAKNK